MQSIAITKKIQFFRVYTKTKNQIYNLEDYHFMYEKNFKHYLIFQFSDSELYPRSNDMMVCTANFFMRENNKEDLLELCEAKFTF